MQPGCRAGLLKGIIASNFTRRLWNWLLISPYDERACSWWHRTMFTTWYHKCRSWNHGTVTKYVKSCIMCWTTMCKRYFVHCKEQRHGYPGYVEGELWLAKCEVLRTVGGDHAARAIGWPTAGWLSTDLAICLEHLLGQCHGLSRSCSLIPGQLAQKKVRPGRAPISIVLYINATFIKRSIPLLPLVVVLWYK